MPTTPILLIGPICAGKSTVAQLLAETLGLPRVELDEQRWTYYEAAGFDHAIAKHIMATEGTLGILRYSKPFEVYAVEQAVRDYPNAVMDLGAGHSVYEEAALFERVAQALAPLPNVILLLPSPDVEQSVAILNARFAALLEREMGEVDARLLGVNEQFVRHPSNQRLATLTVYTEGQTPAETCAAIIPQLR